MSEQVLRSSNEKLRVGILGSGNWAKVHAQVIERCQNLEVVAFFSRVEEYVTVEGKIFRCYSSIEKMIGESSPHICLVANATKFHYVDALCVLNEGTSVLIEKPLNISFDEALNLERLARTKDLFVGVSLPQRYDKKFLQLNSLLKSNYFGSVDFVDIKTFYHRSDESINHTLSQAGAYSPFALLMHYGVHYYDAACNALELRDLEVNSYVVRENYEGVVKSATFLLTPKDSKTTVSLTFSTTSCPGRKNSLEVIGSKDSIYLNRNGLFLDDNANRCVQSAPSFEDYLRLLWLDYYDLMLNGDFSTSRISLDGLLALRHLFPSHEEKNPLTFSEVLLI